MSVRKDSDGNLIYDENKIFHIVCDTWEDFIQESRRFYSIRYYQTSKGQAAGKHTVKPKLFRGHANPDWKLSSALERNYDTSANKEERWEKDKKRIISSFIESTRGIDDVQQCKTANDYWAVGRHFGLLTPLLDWTESPFVAAFFAFEDVFRSCQRGAKLMLPYGMKKNNDGVAPTVHVWALRQYPSITELNELQVIDSPSLIGTRQRRQRGKFTELNSLSYIDLRSFLEDQGLLHHLDLYEIPKTEGLKALRDMYLMNIRPSTLFPDISGITQEANINWNKLSHRNRRYIYPTDVSDLIEESENSTREEMRKKYR